NPFKQCPGRQNEALFNSLLEAAGKVILLGRLPEQQRLEHQVLRSAAALRLRRRGVAEHEILELHEIRATLA
ncbi:hypothetical protein, partial [Burkholderia pseudomallei]|uniref:hypothetical protein n=1 Tax=Burkholderia pseudomallei TaxID=28450 RepID=UPI0009C8728A